MPKLNPELYGGDPTDYAESLASRILGVPDPTLDINGEKDSRAASAGNHGMQGGGSSGSGKSLSSGGGDPALDGGT